MTTKIEAKGILAIGDPHVRARRPARRNDIDFAGTVLGKLGEALALANAERLVPVILGDLYDLGDENDVSVLVRLERTLRSAWTPPWYDMGNHTLTVGRHAIHEEPGDGHSINIHAGSGSIRIFSGDGRPDVVIETPTGRIAVGGVGYGKPIPATAPEGWDAVDRALRVLVTHDDVALPGKPIPGAKPPKKIKGIDLAINGHVHDTRVPLRAGSTWWFNPGNITRLSIDMEGHVPSVFSIVPGRADALDERLDAVLPHGLLRHVLRYTAKAFDHEGRRIEASAPTARPESVEQSPSRFVAMMRMERAGPQTQDGGVLREELAAVYEELEVDPAVRALIDGMIDA